MGETWQEAFVLLPVLPVRRPWLLALGGQHCREQSLCAVECLRHPLPEWATACPWPHVRQLSSLLWDMVPVDVHAFVASAPLAMNNPVALLLMALVKDPCFVGDLAEAVQRGRCMTATLMAKSLHQILWDLDSCRHLAYQHNLNTVADSHMLGLCTTMLNLGMLTRGDGSNGVALGPMGTRYNLVTSVPQVLKDCFTAAGSHYFPEVGPSNDIAGYMASWSKFLPRLPGALNVGHPNVCTFAHVMTKLLIWLRSCYAHNMVLTVGTSASWCRDSLRLTCISNALMCTGASVCNQSCSLQTK